MSPLGIGAMLHWLGGGSDKDPKEFYGREIVGAEITDTRLTLTFAEGDKIHVWDDGQSCCESRYMTCDDKPADLIGGKLRAIETKKHEERSGEYDEHEQVFVEVATDKASITIVNHNEHNGYYGGFGLTVTHSPKGDEDSAN